MPSLPLLAEFSLLDLWRAAWVLWFFAFGACVGSFLNVAIYRLPAGLNVAYPRSRCPRCGTGIRWYDNVPILSWLLLGGQCRDCGGPIAIRYPFVELLTGVVFVLLLWLEWLGEGWNLPRRYVGVIAPFGEGTFRSNPDSLLEVAFGFHLLLVTTLIAAALIDYDGHPQPLVLFSPAWLVGLFLPLAYPLVRPVPWDARVVDYLMSKEWWHEHTSLPWWERNTPLAAVYDALPAVAFVLATGLLTMLLSVVPGGGHLLRRVPSLTPVATVLLFLGWQTTLVAAAAATVLYVLLRIVGSKLTWNVSLLVATIVTLLAWSWWDGLMPRSGGPTFLFWLQGPSLVLLISSILAVFLAPKE